MTDRRTFLAAGAISASVPGLRGSGLTSADKARLDGAQAAAASSEAAAALHERAASLAATTAMTAAGGLYTTIADGLADTPDGGYFAVPGDDASTYAILYRKASGTAVEQSRYASKSAYEGPSGASLVGFKARSSTAIVRALGDKADEYYTVGDEGVANGGDADRNTDGMHKAIAYCNASGQPLRLPYGDIPIIEPLGSSLTGAEGRGFLNTCIRVVDSADARQAFAQPITTGRGTSPQRNAIIRFGQSLSQGGAHFRIPVRGFRVQGLAVRTPKRSSDPSTILWNADGILMDETSGFTHLIDAGARFCFSGVVMGGSVGHFGATGMQCDNNWLGFDILDDGGDYRLFDCLVNGNLFANIYGRHGNASMLSGRLPGIDGLLLVGTHCGFAPFGIGTEDGPAGETDLPGVAIKRLVAINSSFEYIGNRAIRVGTSARGLKVSQNWKIIGCGHSWAPAGSGDPYTIENDGNYPAKDYAVGPIELGSDQFSTELETFLKGTTGKAWHFVNSGGAVIKDDHGSSSYQIDAGGSPIGTGRGKGLHIQLGGNLAPTNTMISLGTFSIPAIVNGMPQAQLNFRLNSSNTTGIPQPVQVRAVVNGVDQGGWRFMVVPGGAVTTASPSYIGDVTFGSTLGWLGSQVVLGTAQADGTHTVEIRLLGVPDGVTFNALGLPSDMTLDILANTGVE